MIGKMRRKSDNGSNYWPGFVDAMATILLVIMFLLTVFILSQFYLANEISGKDNALDELREQLADLTNVLSIERLQNNELEKNILNLEFSISELENEKSSLINDLSIANNDLVVLQDAVTRITAEYENKITILEDDMEDKVLKYENKITILKDDMEDKVLKYESKITILEDDIEDRILQYELQRDELANRNKIILDLGSQERRLNNLLAIKNIEIEKRLEKISEDSLKIAALNNELDNRKLKILETEKKLTSSEKIIIDLRKSKSSDILSLRDKIKESDNIILDLRKSKSSDILSLRDKIKESDNIILDLRKKNKELDQGLTNLNQTISSITGTNKSSEQIIIDLRKENNKNISKVLNLSNNIKNLSGESYKANNEIKILNIQLKALRQQMLELQALLDDSKKRDIDQKARISDLGKKLNLALAQKVKELSEYRSEFFGKLKEILGDRSDIKIIGDRFIFESEVLFTSGEADINIEGKRQLAKLSGAIISLMDEIPEDVNWILRVDGHTDKQPIKNAFFNSNWELSSARAISVVKFLINMGIPPNKLAATGFGEFQPIDDYDDNEAYRKNRRIELKLTEG